MLGHAWTCLDMGHLQSASVRYLVKAKLVVTLIGIKYTYVHLETAQVGSFSGPTTQLPGITQLGRYIYVCRYVGM